MTKNSEGSVDTKPKSVTNQLIEAIKDLSNAQQEKLLGAIRKWKKDCRKSPRISCKTEVIYSDNRILAQGMILNISASGLYLQSSKSFEIGKSVTICFENPFTENQIKVNGKIVRSDQNGVAIKFDEDINDS